MNVIITGANGFIGRALTARLLNQSVPLPGGMRAVQLLTLLDLQFDGPDTPRVRRVSGSIADSAVLASAFDTAVDVIFHLASVPGGMAEQHYELGRQINLDATLGLLDRVREQTLATGKAPVFVFASTIAVLGAPLPPHVDDMTALHPQLTYGTHKAVAEFLLTDFDRRGWANGRSIRLPGIVARPPQRTGQLSAFMSDVIREVAAGRPYLCPVSANSTTWLMSVHCIVENLLHAALLSREHCGGSRVWTLPALRSSMTELVGAVADVYGRDRAELVRYESNPDLEANFGRHPPLTTAAADAVGFRHDGDLRTLVRRALQPLG